MLQRSCRKPDEDKKYLPVGSSEEVVTNAESEVDGVKYKWNIYMQYSNWMSANEQIDDK